MLTIGRLARRFGLSRSTLLYYDSIGLLRPSARGPSNYRLYSDAEVKRMERIEVFRRAGLPLADVARLLDADADTDEPRGVLEDRLRVLDEEIGRLRSQQRMIAGLLRMPSLPRNVRSLDKAGWVAILRAAGLDEPAMRRWHVEFERLSPGAHQDFLESLGIEPAEIERIRRWSREAVDDDG